MPLPPSYPIVLLSSDDVLAPEEMGSKRKGWVQVHSDPEPWLFKYARMSDGQVTGEHWAEKAGAEIAELLNIPHARVELATLDQAPGSISRRFPELSGAGVELIHGNDLLAGIVLGYDRHKSFRQRDHTLENIFAAIARVIPDDGERNAAFRQLAGYLMLDALILNTDRHHENWALIRLSRPDGRVSHRVAPTFDHASSLGRNEPPSKLVEWLKEPWRPAWYVERAPGAIFVRVEDKRAANPLRLLEVVVRGWPAYFEPWRTALKNVSMDQILSVIDRLPPDLIVDAQKEFAKALLTVSFRRVNEILE